MYFVVSSPLTHAISVKTTVPGAFCFSVMEDLGIDDIFQGDAHFQQVNLNFRLHPANK